MKKLMTIAALWVLAIAACGPAHKLSKITPVTITYHIDITNPSDDLFHVTVLTENLSGDNKIFQFAATAPGTYDVMNFGRFVQSFKAYDHEDREIETAQLSVNQWQITHPESVRKISYTVEDTFDAEIDTLHVAPMCGSGIEEDFILLNNFAVLGYFKGLQSSPVRVKVNHPSDWKLGTALRKDPAGYFRAETFDRLADSPMLLGNLTVDSTLVNGIDVKVYLYSPDTTFTATAIMNVADDILQSAGEFIRYDPVPNYEFLFCLLNREQMERNSFRGFGALEHSYSSLYVQPVPRRGVHSLSNIMAHEFMHILTPLNLHSEIIHTYNFAEPTSDQHIWLYEGVTEWASEIMQLRSGLIDADGYMRQISGKMATAERIDQRFPGYSLSDMSLEAFTAKGDDAFFNFYKRGALTAALLDIRLLELSDGERGLREVFLELLNVYGKEMPFSKDTFLKDIADRTYPEIEQFIEDYIVNARTLPLAEFYKKLGFRYIPERPSASTRPVLDAGLGGRGQGIFLFENVRRRAQAYGLRENDVLFSVFGERVTPENIQEMGRRIFSMEIGKPFELVVQRDGKEITLEAQMFQRLDYHQFETMETLSNAQKTLREAWIKNM